MVKKRSIAVSICLLAASLSGCNTGSNVTTPISTQCASGGPQTPYTGLLTTIPLPNSGGVTGTITLPQAAAGGIFFQVGVSVSTAVATYSNTLANWTLHFAGPAQQLVLEYPPSIALVVPAGTQIANLTAQVTPGNGGSSTTLQPQGSGRSVTFTANGTNFALNLCSTSSIVITEGVPIPLPSTSPSPQPSTAPSASPTPTPTTSPTTAPTSTPTTTPTSAPTVPPPANVYVADCGALCPPVGVGPTTVTAYDTFGNPVMLAGGFPGIKGANGITYASSNQQLYVADCGTCYGTGPTTVLAFTLNGTAVTLPAGAFGGLQQPGIFYAAANNQLYVPDYAKNKVFVFDLQGNAIPVSGTFPNLNGPYGITYAPDNGVLYVANFNTNTVSTFDLQGNPRALSSAITFAGLSSPGGMAYVPAVHLIYVANQTANAAVAIGAYDINGKKQNLPGNFPGTSTPIGIAYDPDSNLLYVTNAAGSITVYNLDGTPSSTGPWSAASVPVGIAIAP